MLDIPITAVVPLRLLTNDIILYIITQMGFVLVTILKIKYFTIILMLQVRTII